MFIEPLHGEKVPRYCLVVGASGGIGLGFVKYFLTNSPHGGPAQVFATYRRWNSDLADLQQKFPDRLHCLPLDLSEEAQIADLAKTLGESIPRLDYVVNCVGLLHTPDWQPEKSLRHLNGDRLQQYFAVNSIGPVLLAKYLLPLLRHPDPSIFATLSAKVGSIGDNSLGGWYGYRASKAALNMFLKTTAIEYKRVAPQAIIVMLHPGTTDTGLSLPFQKNVPPEKLFSVERTVGQLMAVIQGLTPADSGEFFSWDGSRLPW